MRIPKHDRDEKGEEGRKFADGVAGERKHTAAALQHFCTKKVHIGCSLSGYVGICPTRKMSRNQSLCFVIRSNS